MGRCVDAFPTPLPTFSFLLLPFSFPFWSPVSSPCLSPTVRQVITTPSRSHSFLVLLTGQKDQNPPAPITQIHPNRRCGNLQIGRTPPWNKEIHINRQDVSMEPLICLSVNPLPKIIPRGQTADNF